MEEKLLLFARTTTTMTLDDWQNSEPNNKTHLLENKKHVGLFGLNYSETFKRFHDINLFF